MRRAVKSTKMSKENEILRSWRDNARQWIHAVDQRLIASRLYTDEAVLRCLLRHSPRHVLDVGCGEGWLVRKLSETGIEACGVDASAALIAAASERGAGRFFTATYAAIAGNPQIAGGPYDAAVFNFSLLDECVAPLLEAIGSVIAPRGRIIVQTLHPMASGGDYVSGWRIETFAGLAGGDWQPMPWFFRTFEAWMQTFQAAGLYLEALSEPRDPQDNKVLSVVFELRAV